ncbi:hypothetical protein EJB05_41614, partial [Eragrostis curvula]
MATRLPFHGRAERPSAMFSICIRLLIPAATKPTRRPTAIPTTPAAPSWATPAAKAINATASPRSSCTAYLAFRSAAPYSSPITVSYLLNATATVVAAANAVPVANPVADAGILLVPVPCACTAAAGHHYYYYQHDAWTCTPTSPSACPSPAQAAAGFRYLVTYLLGVDDDSNTVADRFHADYQAVQCSTPTASTTTPPDPPKPEVVVLPAPAPAPGGGVSDNPATSTPTSGRPAGPKWRVMFGVGIGCGHRCVLCFCYGGVVAAASVRIVPGRKLRRWSTVRQQRGWREVRRQQRWLHPSTSETRLRVYAVLETATAGFAEENRVGNSSVYRAVIDGDAAAVKRVSWDVGAEVAVLGRVNHARLIRLSGLCAHRGDTHAPENGALGDWLRGGGRVLAWRQRVQVALDVATGATTCTTNCVSPPYVHKNLKIEQQRPARRLPPRQGVQLRPGAQMTRHVYLEHGLIGPHFDVFAFGVIVLELLSGKEAAPARAVSDMKGETLLLWQEAERLVVNGDDGVRDKVAAFVDPRLHGDYPLDAAFALLALALRCVAREPRLRPSMGEVFLSLAVVYGSTLQCHLPYGLDSS